MDKDNRPFKEKEQHVQDILRAITIIQPVVPMLRERSEQTNLFKAIQKEVKTFAEQVDTIEKALLLFENADLKNLLLKFKETLKVARTNESSIQNNLYDINREIDAYLSYAESVYLSDSVFRVLVEQNYNSKWSTDKFLAMLLISSCKGDYRPAYSVRWAINFLHNEMKSQPITRTSKRRIAILESIKTEGDDYFDEIISYIENH